MPQLDTAVAALVDNYPSKISAQASLSDDDEDDLIASLENEDTDPALSALRAARLEQLHHEYSHASALRAHGTGTYTTLNTDKAVLDATTDRDVKRCVVHFSKSDFGRCAVMDGHLGQLAGPHYEARFVKADVENVPFLVEKLKIRVLPCIVGFVDGKSVERVVGFEGLGNGERFKTRDLERRLVDAKVLVRMKIGQQHKNNDSDDDDQRCRNGRSIKDRKFNALQDDDEEWD